MRASRSQARQSGDKNTAAERLREAGLRPTKQRVALANLLFGKEDRHLSAETLHDEARRAGVRVSLATVYNTLHQFTDAHLLKQVTVEAGRSYFDTNLHDHQHFYLEDEGVLIDIPGTSIEVAGLPAAPRGLSIDRVDVVVRLKRN
ncbi:MAG TPA: Fur family transcriptional regulator [Rhizomicrobium sp.]|nr:Fur family transcriptional regulator [Rhizomicrobium sp.]